MYSENNIQRRQCVQPSDHHKLLDQEGKLWVICQENQLHPSSWSHHIDDPRCNQIRSIQRFEWRRHLPRRLWLDLRHTWNQHQQGCYQSQWRFSQTMFQRNSRHRQRLKALWWSRRSQIRGIIHLKQDLKKIRLSSNSRKATLFVWGKQSEKRSLVHSK